VTASSSPTIAPSSSGRWRRERRDEAVETDMALHPTTLCRGSNVAAPVGGRGSRLRVGPAVCVEDAYPVFGVHRAAGNRDRC
jgi:hypothetical protein